MKKKVGFIGWRGMVGSVLLERMENNGDFNNIDAYFFTTSQIGSSAPINSKKNTQLLDAYNINLLSDLDIVISCQGSDYTNRIHTKLTMVNWKGYWIDAASHLRCKKNSIIVLDPINKDKIIRGLNNGIKNYIGGNCTVSLMLLAINGLIKNNLVDWINVMSYQAISGAGAKAMKELLDQQAFLSKNISDQNNILTIENKIRKSILKNDFPINSLNAPLALNLLPWIDTPMPSGQTKEEWKSMEEANKILDLENKIKIDGTCVRVPTLRSHSQALTIKLKKSIPLNEIKNLLTHNSPWVKFVENNKNETYQYLTPLSVSNTLDIAIGRVRKSLIDKNTINLFTVGDQLLWGAAEPIRRTLNIIVNET